MLFRVSLILASVSAFVVTVPAARHSMARHGFLEDLMDKLEGKDSQDWKEDMYREQQEILKRRRKTGGFIDEEQEKEIAARRASFAESEELTKLQKSKSNDDIVDKWKQARDAGKFKTATKGLKRDEKSSRLGSAGLFAERVDERLPYIDRGYVKDKKEGAQKPNPAEDFFDGLKDMFGGKK